MRIAIHFEPGNNFSPFWLEYCKKNNLPYKIVNCYDNDIISQLEDCKFLLWHINNLNYKDQIFAKNLIYAVESRGIKCFPDFNTIWHFDNKTAQKYLFEAMGINLIPTYVFYDKRTALIWVETQDFPKVFKLSKGSGSKGVRLCHNPNEAKKLINTAFGKGFKIVSGGFILKERIRKYKKGQDNLLGIFKGLYHFIFGTEFLKMSLAEKGYIYFQDFIKDNPFDTRVIVIGHKAIAIKRMNRDHDFRASGSGNIIYDPAQIDHKLIRLAFDLNDKLKMQSAAFDFVYDEDGKPLVIEVSYGFNPKGYVPCPGYWDRSLLFHGAPVRPQEWMLEDLLALAQS